MKLLVLFSMVFSSATFAADKLVKLLMVTNYGEIHLELNETKAPITVKNFLKYVDNKHYDGVIFHRVIKNFMIQTGGFDNSMTQKKVLKPIKNEAKNGLKNEAGTLAMARTNVVNSATAQFFINVKDNSNLNYQSDANYGYAVFGKVTKGMPVVKKIEMVKTGVKKGYRDVPTSDIVIKTIKKL